MKRCAICQKQAKFECEACEAEAYCGSACQKVHWNEGHAEECQSVDASWRYRLKSIVEIVVRKREFSTLKEALQQANLVATLEGAGPFTVFAPSNAAFEKIPPAQLRALLNDRVALQDVLLYHVAVGKVKSSQLLKSGTGTLPMANGKPLDYRVQGGQVLLNNGASFVTKADIRAKNGVVHVVSDVLMPPM